MTEEVQNQEQEVQTPVDDDAGFEAGFAEARGEEPPTEAPQAEEPQVSESKEPQPEVAQEQTPEPEPEVVFAGLTESQLKSALAKANEVDEVKAQLRQAFGKLGEYNARLQQIQGASAAGQPREITADQLTELNEEFPDLAARIAKDLSKISLGGGQAQFDPAPIREELSTQFREELDKIRRQSELKILTVLHRDWQTIRSSDDFKLWESTLPAEERQQLNDSEDALFVASEFDKFKEWRQKATEAKQKKDNRLANAVTPKGVAAQPSTINDDDALLAGFKAIRRA